MYLLSSLVHHHLVIEYATLVHAQRVHNLLTGFLLLVVTFHLAGRYLAIYVRRSS